MQRMLMGCPSATRMAAPEGFTLYIGPKFERSVVFIGFEDSSSPTGMRCVGTGFLVIHKGAGYLITARHVAEPIGSDPFVIRVNRRGRAELLQSDFVEWAFHPDASVDLAAVRIHLPLEQGWECEYLILEKIMLSETKFADEGIGAGSLCYTLGLFQYVYGREKNLPMVHAGHISLLPPPNERIPVWDRLRSRTEQVQGFLIESGAIDGASGSPVFARPTITTGEIETNQGMVRASWPEAKILLVGLFQGAWFAPPDAPLAQAVQARPGAIVPVGIGIVIPADKILELLETPEMNENRGKSRPVNVALATSIQDAKGAQTAP